MEISDELRTAIEEEISSVPLKTLADRVAELSDRYRAGRPSVRGKFVRSPQDVLAYVASRSPATYAAVFSALAQVKERLPSWHPVSLVDVGAGPGTAMWAATDLWPEISGITLVEADADMMALGRRLAERSPHESVQQANWIQEDLTEELDLPPQGLVVASYVMGEMPIHAQRTVVRRLWEMTEGTLVIVEPGTPTGFSHIRDLRAELVAMGGTMIAPCPHDRECPMGEGNWCHFSERVARSRAHRQLKGAELPYEDEKFSYVAASRTPGLAISGRVIRHPQVRKGHIRLEVCTPDGIVSQMVTRKDQEGFRRAHHLGWGSSVDPKG